MLCSRQLLSAIYILALAFTHFAGTWKTEGLGEGADPRSQSLGIFDDLEDILTLPPLSSKSLPASSTGNHSPLPLQQDGFGDSVTKETEHLDHRHLAQASDHPQHHLSPIGSKKGPEEKLEWSPKKRTLKRKNGEILEKPGRLGKIFENDSPELSPNSADPGTSTSIHDKRYCGKDITVASKSRCHGYGLRERKRKVEPDGDSAESLHPGSEPPKTADCKVDRRSDNNDKERFEWLMYSTLATKSLRTYAKKAVEQRRSLKDVIDKYCKRPKTWYNGLIDHPATLVEDREVLTPNNKMHAKIVRWAQEARDELAMERELRFMRKVEGSNSWTLKPLAERMITVCPDPWRIQESATGEDDRLRATQRLQTLRQQRTEASRRFRTRMAHKRKSKMNKHERLQEPQERELQRDSRASLGGNRLKRLQPSSSHTKSKTQRTRTTGESRS